MTPSRVKIFPLALGTVSLLSLLFFIFPWSLSTQTSSFSLSLDLDSSEGDQAISSLDVFPNRTIPIQIFGTDIQQASDLSLRFEFDPTQVAYEGFKRTNIVSGTSALTGKDFANIGITLSAGNAYSGLIGTIHFRTTEAFSGTDIGLVRARLVREGQTETVSLDLSVVTLRLAKSPSPDFNGNGIVDIPDFLLFVDVFGTRRGQDSYESKYDLNVNGEIGIPDFLIFVDNFGKVLNRIPVFTVDSDGTTPVSSVTRSVAENTPPGQAIGDPISATDGDGNTLTYRLSGDDADSFAIDTNTGQIQTKETYDFEQKNSYSVIVIVSDGEGGEASLEVNITIKDTEEATGTVPSNVMVEEDDGKLIVRWDAVPNEEGKPPVIGYEVGYRERPDPFDAPQENSNEWKGIQRVSSQLDSLIITGLLNGQAYLVSVRTLVDGGMSAWSSPVLGIPVIPAAEPVFPGGGGGGGGGGGTPPPPPPPPPPGPNRPPTFNDGPSTSRRVAENTAPNRNIQHPVSATDDDRDRLTYSLSGNDANSFTIITSNGQLRTRSGVTYNYEVKNRYEVTVETDDNRGGTATIDVTIYVADVNEPPQAPARPQVAPTSSTSLTVTWTEPTNTGPDINDYDVQYRTGSGNFLPYPHNNTGTTTTITNLEVNTRYEVQVKAYNDEGTSLWSSSGYGNTSANQRPIFDETAPTRSLAENTTGTRNIGSPVRATDPEGRTVSYSLVGGDMDQFTIITSNGQLRIQTGVDYNFEVKNRYSVTVEAADDQGGRATITVTIDITDDDNERPERPDEPAVTASTLNSLSIRWTAPVNTGPNINDYDVQYSENRGAFTDWPHTGTGTSTTITSLTANTSYQVQVLARSPEGESQWSESVTVSTVANQAPTFNRGTRITRSFAENTTGTHDIGNPITATDRDGGTPSYSLEGTDQASFALDNNQLQTLSGETYDYEEKNSYEVIVRVEDGQGGSNTIEVTINLTDVREPPETPDPPIVSAASSTSLTVTWDEPTNTGPDISDYDVQYREGDSGNFTSWSHNSADRTATITGRTPDTSHQVQVRARNAEGTSDWSGSGTGSTSANGLPVFTDGGSATRSFAENTTGVQNIGDPVSATDPENTTLTYSLEGTDADSFTFDTRNGQICTKSGETYDYETQSRYFVDVKATDGHGGDRTITVFIDLTDVNEAPTFTSDAAFDATENNQFAGRVDAEDVDSADRITDYTITAGSDRDLLEISSGGVLTFKDAPNFENPTDSGRNNTYIVVVTVTGGTGGRAMTAVQTITITVTDENELPHFTSDDAFMAKENNPFVGRMAGDDIDRADSVTGYEVTGGTDQNEFEITNTNQLHFKDDPDFENPTDSGSNNEYIVEVTATGGTDTRARTVTQEITVTIEDDDEPPGKPDPPTASNETENSLTVSWDEPTNTGPDITNYHVQYRISGTFTDWPDTGPSRTRTITSLRSGRTYQIQVQAENDEGKGTWSNPGSGTTLTAPTVSSVAFTSTPASGQNNTYKLNDIIDVTVTFNEAVSVTDMPQIDLTIGSTVRQADYQSGSTTPQLLFQYTVQNTDSDTDGASINANGLKLNGGRIRRNGTAITADLVHTARTNQSSHKVDGIAPALTEAEVKGDELTLSYEEVIDGSSRPATGDFAVTVDGTARDVSTVTMSSSEVELTLASAVTSGQTVRLAYTPGTNPIRDRARNPAIALTNLTVANRTQDPTVNICSRTSQVRDAIVDAAGVSACGDVTEDHLAAITRLSLSDESISTLKADDFSGLSALEELYLSDNNITSLPATVFSNLSGLEHLDLEYARLTSLPATVFSNLSGLEHLNLSRNEIGSLDAGLFSGLTALTHLDLVSMDLTSVPGNLFSGLTELEFLDLSYNIDLTTLPATVFSGLTELRSLHLRAIDLTTLPDGLLSGLTELRSLDLRQMYLSTLPDGVFSGLTELTRLWLQWNTVDPLPITVSLETSGTDQFRAKAHTGAPFDMVLPLRLANGEIDSGEQSITIPQGSVESGALSVSRTAGTKAAVTVDLGALLALPAGDNGYELVRSGDLPLVVIAAEKGVEIYPTELTMPEDDSDTYTVVLTMQPTADVTVTVTVPSDADVTVNPSPLTFTADNWDTPQTVTVTSSTDTDTDDDEVTLSHTVSGGGYQGVTADDVTVNVTETAVSTNSPPSIFHNSRTVDENFTGTISIVGTDPDDRDYITGYELTGGRDRALFEITTRGGRGELSFVDVPDYERPAGTSNRNEIIVTVTSGMGTRERTGQQQIAINVSDVDEPPGQPLAPKLSVSLGFSPTIAVSQGGRVPLANTGPDINAWGVGYRAGNSGDFITSTHISSTLDARIENLSKDVTYEVQVQARNDEGESEWSPTAEIEIPNQPPVAVGSFDDLTLAVGGAVEVVPTDGVFSTQDGDLLTYTASSSNTVAASVQMIGEEVLVDPGSAGSATITVTASDPYGASDSESFNVSVQTPTLAAPTLTISGNLFTLAFTDDFADDETRAYQVRIRQKTNHGPWATGCHTETNDEASPQSISVTLQDAVSEFFEPGTTYEADYGYLGTACDGSLTGSRSATAEVTTSGTPSFDIDLVFVGSISSTYRSAVEAAAERWERIITGDVPNHRLSTENRNSLNEHFPGTTAPEVVDDLVIYLRSVDLDGPLGQTWTQVRRVPSALPTVSRISIDRDILSTYSVSILESTVLHEMGHALGYSSGPWEIHNLLKNPSRDSFGRPIHPSPDTYFSGANAVAAFDAAGGSSYSGAKVPVENTLGPGSRDSHWRESVMQSELMAPRLGGTHPLSAITIQSMADIGYTVDVTQADAYTLPASTKIAIRSDGLIPLNCVIEHPEVRPDKPEPVILNLKPVDN